MEIKNAGTHLFLKYGDGFSHQFHAFWLRESSSNEEYRDSKTGHKLQDADQIPLDVAIQKVINKGHKIGIHFSDGHYSEYSSETLRRAVEKPGTKDLIGEKILWDSSLNPLPWYELKSLEEDPKKLLNLLNDIAHLGFALIRNVPPVLQGMAKFIDLIGYMRLTNNGGIEDIKSLPAGKAYDLSMTPMGLEAHVDNPYRVPQPGYVLLHCLKNDANGGESFLIDGFKVAEKIKNYKAGLFEALCNVPVVYRYDDNQAILEHTAPFIDVFPDGTIKQTRFHGRCDQVVAADCDTLSVFYEARRYYTGLMKSKEMRVCFKLKPGEMFILDNYRLFHGRNSFRLDTGARHMQQAYIDRDVVSSRQKTLLRNINSEPWAARVQ